MIWELVKKDFRYMVLSLKSTWVSVIVFSIFFPLLGIGFGLVVPALICYIGFYGVLAYEERSKMHLLNMTLPVTRKELCLSKYAFAGVILVISVILSSLGTTVGMCWQLHTPFVEAISQLPFYMVIMLAVGVIYVSIILPCIFKWGTIKARYMLMGLYIVAFVVASNIEFGMMNQVTQFLNRIFFGNTILSVGVITILVAWISTGISLNIWEKKDIN